MRPDSGPARFVAFSLVDGQPIAASHTVRKALEIAGDLASFGIGHHPLTEVLDCKRCAKPTLRASVFWSRAS